MRSNRVGALLADNFGSFSVLNAQGVSLASNGNVTIGTQAGTSFIVRRVVISNANKDISTANVTIFTSPDGAAANLIAGKAQLSNVSSTSTYQDLTLNANCATKVYTTGCIMVTVANAVSGGSCDINVYGDIVVN